MNNHFEDARYSLKRAGETAKKGVSEELAALEDRVQNLMGGKEEPEASRLESL